MWILPACRGKERAMALYIRESCIGCGACRRVCPVSAVSGQPRQQHGIDIKQCIECYACGRVCPTGSISDFFNRTIVQVPRTEWEKPRIIPALCTGCGTCAEICPAGVLKMAEVRERRIASVEHPSSCISCYWCRNYCMFSAIDMVINGKKISSVGEEKYQ